MLVTLQAVDKPVAPFRIVAARCTACGYCRLVCPAKAIDPPPRPLIRNTCVGCGRCLRTCPSDAIEVDT